MRDDLLLAAAAGALVVALAEEFPETISGMEHGAAHGAEGIEHHGLHQMHVKTVQGVKFYHLPIGTLIIAHPHLKGDEAKGRKLLHVGKTAYAVPHDADVHVPADTDLTNDSAVKGAVKHIVMHGPSGEERVARLEEHGVHELHSEHPGDKQAVHGALAKDWKKLPEGEAKKPVHFGGQLGAWVPHNWQVYKNADQPEDKIMGKWAKDPGGSWHLIHKYEGVDKAHGAAAVSLPGWVKSGKVIPDEELHAPPGAVEPSLAKAGAQQAKADVGGIAASKDEIHKAIEILTADKSTAVKQPLKAKGHPLAGMDYHGVAKAELAAHPELKVDKGSKAKHVGQVKVAVLHHLAGKAAELAGSDAQAAQEEHAVSTATAQAVHAQDLTGAKLSIGGVEASKEDVEQAIAALQGTKATAIKQTLQHKGNPLAKTDYWAAVKAHQAEFPNSTQGMKAKEVFIAHLQHTLGKLGTADQESGHDQAAAVHTVLDKGEAAKPDDHSFPAQAAKALQDAHQSGGSHYLTASDEDKLQHWDTTALPPGSHTHYVEATPDHKLIQHSPGTSYELGPEDAAQSVAQHMQPLGDEAKEAAKDLPAPEPVPVPGAALSAQEWKADPDWEHIHELVSQAPLPKSSEINKMDTEHSLAATMVLAHMFHTPRYLVVKDDGTWSATSHTPAAGSFGSPAKPFYRVGADHSIQAIDIYGDPVQLPHEQVLGMAKKFLSSPVPEPEPEHAEPTMEVHLGGKLLGTAPAGSSLWHDADYPEKGVFVKKPDGTWTLHWAHGKTNELGDSLSNDHFITNGQLKPANWAAEELAKDGGAAKYEPDPDFEVKDDDELPEPAKDIPVTEAGQVVAHAPAGSHVYYMASYGPEDTKYVKTPDGQWQVASKAGGLHSVDQNYDYAIGGIFTEHPSTSGEAAHVAEQAAAEPEPAAESPAASLKTPDDVQAVLASGVVDPAAATASWQAAAAHQMSQYKKKYTVYVHKAGGQWLPGAGDTGNEHVAVFPHNFEAIHTDPGGKTTPLSFGEVSKGLAAQITPGSVLANGQLTKHGFYSKPGGKAFLEVKPAAGTYGYNSTYKHGPAAKASYVYHDTKGNTKVIPPSTAAKHLEGMSEYSTVPKDQAEPAGLKQVAYAAVAKPGTYKVWSEKEHGPSSTVSWDQHEDESAHMIDGAASTAFHQGAMDAMLQGGALLDSHGTTVVKPGVTPAGYHLFGSPAMSKDDLQGLLASLQQAHDSPAGTMDALSDHIPGWQDAGSTVHAGASSFLGEHAVAGGWQGQRDAITGLLHELQQVPEQPSGTVLAGSVEPKFLQSLPPGIHSAKDVFTWSDQGYALPFSGSVSPITGSKLGHLGTLTSPELTDKIKAIGAEFGGGKVVGTHSTALTKDQKVTWLQSWRKGDMTTVFHLDAMGGKVSPAHPGAPANEATHDVTWAPWGHGQVPASEAIPGAWSDHEHVTLPKAEVANYLIKGGLQHPENLSDAERRQWVVAHRQHNQELVDHLSRTAHQRWEQGHTALTATPSWTDDIQPAKSYDAYVENKTPATAWTQAALKDFLADHQGELAGATTKVASEYGAADPGLAAKLYPEQIIQHWQSEHAAKAQAELSKPVYKLTPGATALQSSHPIYDLTATVPATGNQSRWLFKPAPAHEAFLADQEHTAAQLGHAWGFKTPASRLLEFGGQHGQAQQRLEAEGDLSYGKPLGFYDQAPVQWGKLSQQQVSDVAREHLLDWALDNDDGRASNFLRMPDGSIVGIDKGRSWANFGQWQGLAGDHQADARSAQVSTQLYDAVRSHQISQPVADQAYIDTMQRAAKMQRLPDDKMRAMLEQAFAQRTSFGAPGSKDALVQAAIDRKNSLPDDFGKLWGQVYAKAGWQLPEVPVARLPEGPGGAVLHSGFSDPDFIDHVKAAKSYGMPAFFKGTELEDGHVLVWHEYAGDNPVIRGETGVRGGSYDKMVAWAAGHQTHGPDNAGYAGQFSDVGNIKGEHDLYTKIIGGAKTVSHHATDKQFNTQKMDEMAAAKSALENRLTGAEGALAKGPDSSAYLLHKESYGDPVASREMAKYYLAHIAKVEQARDTGGTFAAGDLPRWEPPKAEVKEVPGLQVHLKPATRALGTFDDNGELHTTGATYNYPGMAWHVELPTGETIEVHNGDTHGVKQAHTGRVRFQAVEADGAASLERVRSQLQSMGLGMHEAEAPDMELQYWRHLGNVLNDRKDATEGKYGKVWGTLNEQAAAHGVLLEGADRSAHIEQLAHAGLAPEDEAGIWRSAWGNVTSPEQVQQFVDRGGHLPHQGHFDIRNAEAASGKPYWMRFDASPEYLAGKQMPVHSLSDYEQGSTKVTSSGGLFSTESRLRALGLWAAGMSSTSDMSHGSSGTVFTRLSQEHSSGAQIYLNPRVLARTSTYGFGGDKFGEVKSRKTEAYFDPKKAASWGVSNNETMIKDGVGLLDDIELVRAGHESQRQEIISMLHSAGIKEIRGMPVEDRIVTSIGKAETDKVRANWAAHPETIGW